jgi:Zn-dependent protease
LYLIGKDEAIQITISVLAISLAFGIYFADLEGMFRHPKEFAFFLLPLLVTVGGGFILHEMAHKLLAIYYGAAARFQMSIFGLVAMLVTSLFGFVFAAPGAVYIYSDKISRKENGLISLVGPLVNLSLVLFFLFLQGVAPVSQFYTFLLGKIGYDGFGISGGNLLVWNFGAAINLVLALFNMIPVMPLDGSKVLGWSKIAWIGMMAVLFGMTFFIVGPIYIVSWIIMALFVYVLSKFVLG